MRQRILHLSEKFQILSQNKDKIMRQTNQSYEIKVNNYIKSHNYELKIRHD